MEFPFLNEPTIGQAEQEMGKGTFQRTFLRFMFTGKDSELFLFCSLRTLRHTFRKGGHVNYGIKLYMARCFQ